VRDSRRIVRASVWANDNIMTNVRIDSFKEWYWSDINISKLSQPLSDPERTSAPCKPVSTKIGHNRPICGILANSLPNSPPAGGSRLGKVNRDLNRSDPAKIP
jgi:hypothetical protein